MFSSRLFCVRLLRGKEKPIFFTGDADMNARCPALTMAIVLVFAAAWYISRPISTRLQQSRPAAASKLAARQKTETTGAGYGRLKRM